MIFIFICSIFLYAHANPITGGNTFYHSLDSLFELPQTINFATVSSDKKKIYIGADFQTMDIPFEKFKSAFVDYNWFTKNLRVIRKFTRISDGPNLSPLGTYDFEARISIARGWAILNVDSIQEDISGYFRLILVGNDNEALNSNWEPSHKGIFISKCDDVYIEWRFKRVNDSKTRVGFITWMTPRAYVPQWLFKFAAKIALPGILKDLESAIRRKNSVR